MEEEGLVNEGLIPNTLHRATTTPPPSLEPPLQAPPTTLWVALHLTHILPTSGNHTQVWVTPSHGFPPLVWLLVPPDLLPSSSPHVPQSSLTTLLAALPPNTARQVPPSPALCQPGILCPQSSQDLLPHFLQGLCSNVTFQRSLPQPSHFKLYNHHPGLQHSQIPIPCSILPKVLTPPSYLIYAFSPVMLSPISPQCEKQILVCSVHLYSPVAHSSCLYIFMKESTHE